MSRMVERAKCVSPEKYKAELRAHQRERLGTHRGNGRERDRMGRFHAQGKGFKVLCDDSQVFSFVQPRTLPDLSVRG